MFSCYFQIQGESKPVEGAAGVKYRGVFGTIATMVRTEGARSLYNGLVAGLQRQMSFASVRIGLYDSMKQFYTRGSESKCYVIHIWCVSGVLQNDSPSLDPGRKIEMMNMIKCSIYCICRSCDRNKKTHFSGHPKFFGLK